MARLLSRSNLLVFRFFSSSPPPSFPYIKERPASIYHPSVDLIESCHATCHLLQLHAHLTTLGLFPFWSAKLLRRCSSLGDLNYAVLLFKHIDSPGTFCANNLLKAYSVSSIPERAVQFYFETVGNGLFFPNSHTFVSLIGSCAKTGSFNSGRKCHGQALKHGVDAALPVQNALIHLYGSCGVIEFARKVFDGMSARDLVSWNSIVSAYASVGELGVAHELFDAMPERNVVSWNVMIRGYLKGNNPGCAMMVFRKMVRSGLRGNDSTISSVISACGRSKRLREGRSVHGLLVRWSFNYNVIVCTSLIDMYSKCWRVELARRIFNKMLTRNLVSWNAMIIGHCIHGNPEDGLNLFAGMVDLSGSGCGKGIVPDEVTYIGLLCACARLGLLSEGKKLLIQMIDEHGVKPNFAHYWCMANIYVRAGLIQAAEDLLMNMPDTDMDVPEESLLWANLFTHCRFQGDATVGERIAKSLIDMDPWNFAHYRLLVNIYAATGQWDGVARVHEMVKEKKIKRQPGCSLIDLKDVVHEYKVGLGCQEGMHEINTMVDERAERPSL